MPPPPSFPQLSYIFRTSQTGPLGWPWHFQKATPPFNDGGTSLSWKEGLPFKTISVVPISPPPDPCSISQTQPSLVSMQSAPRRKGQWLSASWVFTSQVTRAWGKSPLFIVPKESHKLLPVFPLPQDFPSHPLHLPQLDYCFYTTRQEVPLDEGKTP